jgi:hypothetical protein
MFIRWQKYRSVARWHSGEPPIKRVKAILVEAVRIDGKPRQRHVAFIESYEEGKLDQIGTRSIFWRRTRKRLDRLANRITPEDRIKIEAALALHVPPTTPAEDKAYDQEMDQDWQSLFDALAARR